MRFPLGAMTVGDVLDRGLKVLFARLPAFYAINLLVLSPYIAVQIAAPLVIAGGEELDLGQLLATMSLGLFALLLAIVLQPIGTAAILHIVMEEYAGRRPTIREALAFALSRFLPLIAASLLVGLLIGFGFLMCCIPGIYFAITYIFVGQVVVLERLGPTDAMQRSQRLISGHWWRVFGVILLVQVGNAMIQGTLGQVLQFLLPAQEIIPAANGPRIKINPLNHVIDTLITNLVAILFASYVAVCTTLLYLDLRIRKEGFDLELAALAGEEPADDRDRYDDRDDRYDDDRYDDDRYDDDRDRDRGRNRDRDDRYDDDRYDDGRDDRDRDDRDRDDRR